MWVLKDFIPLQYSVVINGALGDWCLNWLQIIIQLLPSSFGHIHHLSRDHPHSMRQVLTLQTECDCC